MIPPVRSESGFTLPEAAVAAGLLASALVALAGLFTLSIQSGFESRTRTSETLLAQQKVEELVSAVNTGSIASTAGVEYLDAAGQPAAPGSTVFASRWSVSGLPAAPDAAVIIRVEVTTRTAFGTHGDGVRILAVRRRRTP
ncbi:MAG TPA: hypothetical protein VFV95_07740 [Vicinamibacterales bacterium]|nr:hypothetical protein [Vicinamibacterales bacterium]